MLNSKLFRISLVNFIVVYALWAQFPQDVPYQSIHTRVPPLPPLYGSYIDTTLPSPIRITRITDYVPDWDWYPHHEYSKIQPWNINRTYYKFYSVAVYDAETYTMLRELPGSEIYPSYWSNTDPDLIYGFKENGDIKTYRISTDSVIFHDHITDSAGNDYEVVKLGPGEGNIDKYDRYVAFVGKRGQDLDVIIYDLSTFTTVFIKTFSGAWGNGSYNFPEYIDWVSVSQSGDYVGIMWDHNSTSSENPFNGHYGVEIYDRSDMSFKRRIAEYGNHGDFCYSADGNEVFVQFWGPSGSINMYSLETGERTVISSHPDFVGEGHISCRNILRPGWAYVSQDDSSRSGQIVAVKLDTSGLCELFGHHFSSSANYLKSPMPVPSPDGKMIMFKSDFWDTTEDVVYEFVATLDTGGTYVKGEKSRGFLKVFFIRGNYVVIKSRHSIKDISIFSLNGAVLKRYKIDSRKDVRLNVRSLPRGLYVMKISYKDRHVLKPFIRY